MELLNATKMAAGYTMGMNPDGRESLVVAVKGTYAIPDRFDAEPRLLPEQAPLVEADTFTGEPGFSAPVYESDYPPIKHRCDVLLVGNAYAPGGRPATRVTVSLRVGAMQKSFDVVGDRVWRAGLLAMTLSQPEPFTIMPISYDRAFGGTDHSHEDPDKHAAYRPNPVGRGFHVNLAHDAFDGKPLPNTEESGKTIRDPQGNYRPMAFGPVGRGWLPRATYAGTYDDEWLANRFPFLPDDFDERYYQAAPDDQQIDHPTGGEEVELVNLTPGGRAKFRLPPLELPVEFFLADYQSVKKQAVVDTILIEPDLGRFSLTWRTSIALRRNVFEVPLCVVGTMPRGWYRARELGKTYYPSLNELIADRA